MAPANTSGSADDTGGTAFEAFLSHRYRSPAVNLYFYGICSRIAQIQFEVDEGDSPISIARLARMIRDADAFIGIYPFPAESGTPTRRGELLEKSQYFRLELSLAARAKVPVLAFYDERYRSVLEFPESAFYRSFDSQEVTGHGGMPTEQRHLRTIRDFYQSVSARMSYRVEAEQRVERTRVGLLLPPGADMYDDSLVSALAEKVEERGYEAVKIPWPASADVRALRAAAALDWLVVDPGDGTEGALSLGWLEGQGVPIARLRKLSEGSPAVPHAEEVLYRNFEVGYDEDRTVWTERDALLAEFDQVIERIIRPVRRINTLSEAQEYFNRAERRPEKVFLSYASENADIARRLSEQLKKKFTVVFDYQDGISMTTGTGYPTQLYKRLAQSEIGVPILSADYVRKGTCQHEAEDMCAHYDSHKMFVYPLNVDGCKPLDCLRTIQFESVREETFDAKLIVEEIASRYESWLSDRQSWRVPNVESRTEPLDDGVIR